MPARRGGGAGDDEAVAASGRMVGGVGQVPRPRADRRRCRCPTLPWRCQHIRSCSIAVGEAVNAVARPASVVAPPTGDALARVDAVADGAVGIPVAAEMGMRVALVVEAGPDVAAGLAMWARRRSRAARGQRGARTMRRVSGSAESAASTARRGLEPQHVERVGEPRGLWNQRAAAAPPSRRRPRARFRWWTPTAASEVDDRVRDLGGGDQPAHRLPGLQRGRRGIRIVGRIEQPADPRGVGGARGDRVDADALLHMVGGHRERQRRRPRPCSPSTARGAGRPTDGDHRARC